MQCQAVEDDLRAVKPASEWVEARLVSAGAGEHLRHDVRVCLEEALANLILHAQTSATATSTFASGSQRRATERRSS